LAIAVSSSPANCAIRSSLSAEGASSPPQFAMATPQSRPSTTIGAATLAPSKFPIRTGCSERRTNEVTLSPWSLVRVPGGSSAAFNPRWATTVTSSSDS
jgi:hypothetical protein